MTRLQLEHNQVWVYLAAIVLGLLIGIYFPLGFALAEPAIWPALALLLYTTFVQIPLLRLRRSFVDVRFISALLTGNFVCLPLIAWALVQWLPDNPPLRLGVLLVLLVPCTDWFISFTHMGRGDAGAAVASTPLSLLIQLALLPFYLWLMMDVPAAAVVSAASLAPAALLILVPLLAALATERWMQGNAGRERYRDVMAWSPVPLLAVVILLIAASQVSAVAAAITLLPRVLPIFLAFLISAALLAKLLARLWALPTEQGRTLAFSLGTRNSFLVLPFALALPAGWELTAAVIVMQSLVELAGMLVYLRWIPGRLFADPAHQTHPSPERKD